MDQLIKSLNRFKKLMDEFIMSPFWFKSSDKFGMPWHFIIAIQTGS